MWSLKGFLEDLIPYHIQVNFWRMLFITYIGFEKDKSFKIISKTMFLGLQ